MHETYINVKELPGMGLCAMATKAFGIGDIVLNETSIAVWSSKITMLSVSWDVIVEKFNTGESQKYVPTESCVVFVYKVRVY